MINTRYTMTKNRSDLKGTQIDIPLHMFLDSTADI